MSYIIVQVANGVNPRDSRVHSNFLNGKGVLLPVSCDGFYQTAEDAHGVAAYLAEEYPNLKTMIAEVVVGNDPVDPFSCGPEFPDLPLHPNEAPPAFDEKAAERAKMTPRLRYQIIKRDGYRCRACGFAVQDGAQLHVDHIVAIANGGRTEIDNLQTMCSACNLGKGAS